MIYENIINYVDNMFIYIKNLILKENKSLKEIKSVNDNKIVFHTNIENLNFYSYIHIYNLLSDKDKVSLSLSCVKFMKYSYKLKLCYKYETIEHLLHYDLFYCININILSDDDYTKDKRLMLINKLKHIKIILISIYIDVRTGSYVNLKIICNN
ncbi:hypothetical protein CHBEV_320 [Choristoneura biennis entomopoxvirus]|uniref:Uncharacterized protein n=1 Tax=Choristoneura biennis entomopoxvirus TaxID=10288 RepID=A0A916KPE3_CBEPV|nr:hypothetical protein CHBEV_015 [Choristoneura biennis entomopoxvirus]YP_008004390.1 hypothetical protein CHBEV_320 [Choristoneura biennis entomopoxvirus]CCU55583.1 hypothetical protein CHBEV_015 [Choristoneura biennis entomopoxvirus]CCU55888.1 hypothetical protein CHBEV_320 [Choristoneura biennis entomopoxvirus]